MQFSIWTGCSSSTKPSLIVMGLVKRALSGSEMYCLCCEVRNMLCTCLSYISRSSCQAVGFHLLVNLYGPIDLGLNVARSLTSFYPSLAKLSETPYRPKTLGIYFFY